MSCIVLFCLLFVLVRVCFWNPLEDVITPLEGFFMQKEKKDRILTGLLNLLLAFVM